MAADETDTPDVDPNDSESDDEALRTVFGEDGEDTLGDDSADDEGAGSVEDGLDTETASDDTVEEPVTPLQTEEEDLGALMGSLGLDKKYKTPGAALKAAVEAQKALSARDEYAQIGRELAPYREQIKQFIIAQHQAASQPRTAWQPPHPYDEDMKRLEWVASRAAAAYQRGEVDPEWEALPQERKKKINDFLEHRGQFWNNMFNDPTRLVDDVFAPQVEAIIDRAFQQREMQWTAREFVRANNDLISNPATQQRLSALLDKAVPYDEAVRILRLEAEVASFKAQSEGVRVKETKIESQKDQLRRRVSKRGKHAGKPLRRTDVRNMTDEDLIRHALELDEAGVADE